MRWWAFWRRVQYLAGLGIFFALIFTGIYFVYFQEDSSCFDGRQNGEESGADCGGSCLRICAADIVPLKTLWTEAFKIVDGQYNVVAYVENRNKTVGTPKLEYLFKLHDADGVIIEKRGETTLPIDGTYPIFEGKIYTGKRVPTRTTIEFADDTVWLKGDAGVEQFSLIRRDLISADSKPRLYAEMRNEGLVEVQNTEIIATIFDARRNPLTASKTTVEYFEGRTNQNIAFTWPEPIATTLTSCEVPTDVVLAIDLSGSMNDDGGEPPEPITSVLDAAEAFTNRLGKDDQSGLVTYATDAILVEQLTENNNEIANIISNLSIAPKEEVGSTNTGDAIKKMREEINSSRHNEDARKVAILMTDGLANTPGDNPEEYALSEAEKLKDLNVILFTIGLGEKVNTEFLRSMASGRDHYKYAPTKNQLQAIYTEITAAICEEGAAVIDVIPKVESNFPAFPGI